MKTFKLMQRLGVIGMISVVFFSIFLGSQGMAHADELTNGERKQMINIAHRGASGYAPENTIAAFDKAVEMKADYIEIDVQMTKDDELVVIHDTSVDRTTDGSGKVGDLTYEEIRQLDAGSWFDESFTGELIPSFEEVLDRYRGKIGILIEFKSPSLYPGIEQKIADELVKRNMHKPNNKKIIAQSFNHASIQQFHNLLPSIPIGVLVGYNSAGISDAQLEEFSTYADYVNPNKAMVDYDLVERIHQFSMETHVWTVRDRESATLLFELGVDGIITDYPDYVDPRP